MKISFVWYWSRASEIYPHWRDGLRAAIEHIAKMHTVTWYVDEIIPPPGSDPVLFWGDAQCPFFQHLDQYTGKKGILLSAMPTDYTNLHKVDVVFCESQPVYDAVRSHGFHAMKAFGTDTDFFSPNNTQKDIEYFYPATFSPWKKQSSIAYLGKRLTCVGTVQPDGQEELTLCQNMGVNVEIGYFSAEKIQSYYRRAQHVIIPAVHGSERTVLEAMSMGIVPSVLSKENDKAQSYVQEFRNSEFIYVRDFVEHFYSPKVYANTILKGLS